MPIVSKLFVVLGTLMLLIGSSFAQTINSVSPNWIPYGGGPALYGGPYFTSQGDQQIDGHSVVIDASFNSPAQFGVVYVTYETKWYDTNNNLLKTANRGLEAQTDYFIHGTRTSTLLYSYMEAYWEFEPTTWAYADVTYTIHVSIQDGRGIHLDYEQYTFGPIRRNPYLYLVP